jgi:hypothetical protein
VYAHWHVCSAEGVREDPPGLDKNAGVADSMVERARNLDVCPKVKVKKKVKLSL